MFKEDNILPLLVELNLAIKAAIVSARRKQAGIDTTNLS